MANTFSEQNAYLLRSPMVQTGEIAQPENWFSFMIDSAEVGLIAVDLDSGEILKANAVLCRILQSEPAEVEGRRLLDILDLKSYAEYHRKLLDASESGRDEPFITEYYWSKEDKWLQITARPVIWPNARRTVTAAITDITWIRKCKDEYKGMALYDGKLKLPNGVKLERDLSDMRSYEGVSLICLDVFNLRVINDIYGWDAGDSLLFQIRDWLMEQQIPHSRLYRVDADEFGVLAEKITPEQAGEIAKSIQHRFQKPWNFQSGGQPPVPLYCTVTIAVVHGNRMFESRNMTNLAERILRNPCEQGRITTYDAGFDRKYKSAMLMQQKLAACAQRDMEGFEVYYQPLVDPHTGVWRGMEALCRWDCPGLGRVSPNIFIPEAERLGLIGKIGQWVLETSVRHCKRWKLDKHEDFILDVNVSPLQVKDERFADRVLEALVKHEYPGDKLSLEITESVEFNFDNHGLDTLSKLIGAGISVALDDFGTGYSSFMSLKNLPACILKTEKSFIKNIEKDFYAQQLFRVMVELAHVAEKKLIAEGVETDGQREVLISHKVDLLQGFLFSRPLPPLELERNLYRFRGTHIATGQG